MKEIIHIDQIGHPIKLGDSVIMSDCDDSQLDIGTVTKLTPQKVQIDMNTKRSTMVKDEI